MFPKLLSQSIGDLDVYHPSVVTDRFDDPPKHHYGLIYADPPWRFATWDHAVTVSARGRREHYKTLSIEEIAAYPVGSIAADDCLLVLWRPAAVAPKHSRPGGEGGIHVQDLRPGLGQDHEGRQTEPWNGLLVARRGRGQPVGDQRLPASCGTPR